MRESLLKNQNGKNLKKLVIYAYTLYYLIGVVNPIPAGVLENQDMLGGQFDPHPLNPMFYIQI